MLLQILLISILIFSVYTSPLHKDIETTDKESVEVVSETEDIGEKSGIESTLDMELSNKKIGWGFKREKNAAPYISAETKDLFKRFDSYYIGNESEKVLYLTFDEGYENGYTGKILDALKEHDVPAAFFITGPYLDKETELVRRMIDEGHIVGNHTINHPSMPDITDDTKFQNELNNLTQNFKEIFNTDMKYFRPPMGEYSERSLYLTQKIGYKSIFWSSAYVDYSRENFGTDENAYNMITSQFHNGSIILLHAVSPVNANVLPRIIEQAKSEGYVFQSLDFLN